MGQYILIKVHTFTSVPAFGAGKGARYGNTTYLGIGEPEDIIGMIEEDFHGEVDSFMKRLGDNEDADPYVSWGNLYTFINKGRKSQCNCFLRSYNNEYLYDEDFKYFAIPTELKKTQIF